MIYQENSISRLNCAKNTPDRPPSEINQQLESLEKWLHELDNSITDLIAKLKPVVYDGPSTQPGLDDGCLIKTYGKCELGRRLNLSEESIRASNERIRESINKICL